MDSKNVIAAIALSSAVIVLYSLFFIEFQILAASSALSATLFPKTCGLLLIIFLFILVSDDRFFFRYSSIIYLLGIVLLIAVTLLYSGMPIHPIALPELTLRTQRIQGILLVVIGSKTVIQH